MIKTKYYNGLIYLSFNGETKIVPHRTFTNKVEDIKPKHPWLNTLFIFNQADWKKLTNQCTLVVHIDDWTKAYKVN